MAEPALFENIFFSLLQLLWGGLVLSVPFFVLTFIGANLKKRIQKKFRLSWIQASFASIYLISLLFVLIAFYGLSLSFLSGYYIGEIPSTIESQIGLINPLNEASNAVIIFIKRFAVALVFSLLVLPFALIGSLAMDFFKNRFKKMNKNIQLFLGVYASSFTAFILMLLANWVVPGLISLFFFF